MVLEGATAADDGSFMQDPPPSDMDRYSSSDSDYPSSTQISPSSASGTFKQDIHLDLSKLPRPYGLFGSMDLNPAAMEGIRSQFIFAAALLQRHLRQDEADALAYHFTRGLQISSLGFPIGTLLGGVQAARTRAKFSFPFWTPKPDGSFNPDSFGPIKGQAARLFWHGLRFQVYGFAGAIAASVFFGSYAVSVDAAGKATDERLGDYNEALRKRMKEGRGMEPLRPPPGQRSPITTADGQMDAQMQVARETLEGRRGGRSASQQPRGTRRSRANNDDDMSPTSGAWAEENSGVSSDTGLLSDAQMRSQESREQARSDAQLRGQEMREQADARATASAAENRAPAPFFGAGDDDASPTARPVAASRSSPQQPAGSTWERIRREAAERQASPSRGTLPGTGPPQSQARSGDRSSRGGPQRDVQREQQQQGATLGDSFSFSETDEERQLAKTEAQRDFDARVEKERRGGDFSEGSRVWNR